MPEPISPDTWDEPEMRRILTARDVGALYRALKGFGVSQRQIAERTGQAQSEVSEILNGRQVRDVTVLERIADGLGIPRGHLRLAGDDGAYPGGEDDPDSAKVDEEMRRRALIAATSLAALGRVVQGMGEVAELALPRTDDQPLPVRLSMSHVHAIEAITARLRGVARQYGGQAEVFGVAARYYTRWMGVPATEPVKARLGCALAELHTEAGWCCYDSGMDGTGHFTRALKLADEAGDAYGIANAAWHAGTILMRSGHPDDALKEFQLGQFVLDGFQPGKATPATLHADDPRLPTLTARLNRQSATAYALLGSPDDAKRHLDKAHEGWTPRDTYDRGAMANAIAGVALNLDRFDTAQQFAASALRAFDDGFGRERTRAELLLAEVHVRARDPRGLILSQQAINAVGALQSVAVRRERLQPLAAALEARSDSDAHELARLARRVAKGVPTAAEKDHPKLPRDVLW
ncbi:MAG: helix-turn-helix domain-containing protein [Pseudonocardiaceae bacterium]